MDSPQSSKEDSGLIDILAMQQKAHDERVEASAAPSVRAVVLPAPLSEVPPAVTRNTSDEDLAEFATAAMGTSWTKKVRPSWIAGGVGALVAIVAIASFSGGDSKDAKSASASARAGTSMSAPAAPAAPAPAPELPKAIPPVPPAPVAAAAPAPTKQIVTKPASKKRAKAKKPAGSKLQKVSSSGVSG